MRFHLPILGFFIVFLCSAPNARAIDEVAFQAMQQNLIELQRTVQALQATVQSQAIKIESMEKGQPISIASPRPSLNPEIGVTGTVQAKSTESKADEEGNDTIALKELELNFAQVVDPYSRLDAILAFNDNLEEQNVDIEEAYYTHYALPLGFRGQVGKFRSKIGKQNLQHLHQLNTADYAEVIKDFFGEEGLASSGARLQRDIPNPWDLPFELTGEILRGNNGNSFSGISRRPIFNAHAKTFFETSDNTNLELGWTTLFGDEGGNANYGVKVYGADATWNWLLPEGKTFKFQNEVYFQRRGTDPHANDSPWGFYSLVDYRFSRRFSVGTRFDYVEPLDVTGQHRRTTGISPYLIFWQSEFADFKLQYSHTEPAHADGRSDNAVYLQADFLIGSHKHPVQ